MRFLGDGCIETCQSDGSWSKNTSLCGGTNSGWKGSRGSGFAVCSELLVDYPCYKLNHPDCVVGNSCSGIQGTCNSSCPTPTAADRCACGG